jgi:hypothetical protein
MESLQEFAFGGEGFEGAFGPERMGEKGGRSRLLRTVAEEASKGGGE